MVRKQGRRRLQAVVLTLAGAAASGHSLADRWHPKPGVSWQIQYGGRLNAALNVQVYNIDLFDSSASTLAKLHAGGKWVICYFSAGSAEDWRPDAKRFPSRVQGRNLKGWAGEKWLDIRRLDILMPIMADRIALAAQKGCDAVDPDNVDGYANRTGFPLAYDDQLRYNRALANAAHAADLAVSLKNDLEQVKDLLPYVDFAVNEECFDYGECSLLKPFVAAGKPVFGIEYKMPTSQFCPRANRMNFDFLRKRRDLNAWRAACR
jgi:hypothetical protein